MNETWKQWSWYRQSDRWKHLNYLTCLLTWSSSSLLSFTEYLDKSSFPSTESSLRTLASTMSGVRNPSCWMPMWRTAETLSSAQELITFSDVLFPPRDLTNTRHRTKEACRWIKYDVSQQQHKALDLNQALSRFLNFLKLNQNRRNSIQMIK